MKLKVIIICPIHGKFSQTPEHHLHGEGCPKCVKIKYVNKLRSCKEKIIEKCKEIHHNKYTYEFVEYVDDKSKIIITCPLHGNFTQKVNNHLNGQGCPICRLSKGETKIKKFLEDNKINFTPQKQFSDCRYKRKLPFDFYLPDYNCCIEYQGEQRRCWTHPFRAACKWQTRAK